MNLATHSKQLKELTLDIDKLNSIQIKSLNDSIDTLASQCRDQVNQPVPLRFPAKAPIPHPLELPLLLLFCLTKTLFKYALKSDLEAIKQEQTESLDSLRASLEARLGDVKSTADKLNELEDQVKCLCCWLCLDVLYMVVFSVIAVLIVPIGNLMVFS